MHRTAPWQGYHAGARRILIALVGMAAPASAQYLPPDQSLVAFNRYVSVRERQVSGFATPGIPLSSFTLHLTANVTATYNDNVLALADDTRSDVFVRFSPQLSANSNWSSSLLSFNASLDVDRYASLKTEDSENLNASVYGTHDLGATTQIRAIGRFQTMRESRESQDVFALTRRPVRYRNAVAGLGLSHHLANTLLQLEGDVSRTVYDDAVLRDTGAPVDENFRDSLLKRVTVRAEFSQSPALAYFVQGSFNQRDYSLRGTDPLANARGSRITELLAGTRFELPILARGEIGVGYTRGSYSGAQFNTFSGLAIQSNVTFFPSQLTNVVVSASRSVTDTGIPGSGGYTSLVAGVRIDHELLRTLILSAGASYRNDTFNGVDRTDHRVEFDASASYRFNPTLSAQAGITRLDLASRGLDAYKSFVSDRFLLGIGLRR